MIRVFCDRCEKETTGEKHGAIHGIEDADDNGDGTNQAPDCFDVVCDDCFDDWRAWMKSGPHRKGLEPPPFPASGGHTRAKAE